MVQERSPNVAIPSSAALNSPDAMATTLDRALQQLTALKALRSAAKACQPRLVANSHASLLSCGLRALVGVAKRLDRQLYASEMA